MSNQTNTKPSAHDVFTPRDVNGISRTFRFDQIEVLTGNLFQSGRGLHGTARIDGVVYEVHGAPCGLGCFCAAVIVEVPAGDLIS